MKNSLAFVALFITVFALLPMDLPFAQPIKRMRADQGELIFNKERKENSKRMNCIAFLDDRNLIVGLSTESMIVEVVDDMYKISHFDFLPAYNIVSYPEQKLITVTNACGVGIYQVDLEGEKNINHKSTKKNTKKVFSDKAFLMCEGEVFIACKKDIIKIYRCKNNKIGKQLRSEDVLHVPLCAGPNFSAYSLFHYKAYAEGSYDSWIKKIEVSGKKISSKKINAFPYVGKDVTRFIANPTQTVMAFFVRGNWVIFNGKNFNNLRDCNERWHSAAAFYSDSIVACLTFRKISTDRNLNIRIQYHDVITQEIVFRRLITSDNLNMADPHPSEIVFSPDRSKCAILWNGALFMYTIPLRLWRKTPQCRTFFVNRMFMINCLSLPKELLSSITCFLFLSHTIDSR